jgi:hypothetical protein
MSRKRATAYSDAVAWDPFSRRSTKADPGGRPHDPSPHPDH